LRTPSNYPTSYESDAVLTDGGNTLAVGSNDPVLNLTERGTRNMLARPVLEVVENPGGRRGPLVRPRRDRARDRLGTEAAGGSSPTRFPRAL